MNFPWFLVAVFFVALVVLALVGSAAERKEVAAMPPAARQRYLQNKEAEKQRSLANEQESMRTKQHGQTNPALICPHCQVRGMVRTRAVKRKKGISGGKVMAGLLTGGTTMLVTGLSRKESSTEAYCGNCRSTWHF